MTESTDAAVATADTPTSAEPAKSELKSTAIPSVLKEADTATPQPKATQPKEKPATDATSADKEDDADSSADSPDEEKIPNWMKKRLKRAEQRGRDLGRSEVQDIIKASQAPAATQPTAPKETAATATAKTLADFDYDIEKFNRHIAREEAKAALAERDVENDRRTQERTAAEARTAFEKRKVEFEKRAGEGAWDEMVRIQVDVPQEVIDLLTGHEKDLDIAHYLVHHADELDQLRGKSKLAIARGLATIEAKLSGSTSEELPPIKTKTPPPPPSVQGSGKSSKSIDDMSTAERIAFWTSQKKQRR